MNKMELKEIREKLYKASPSKLQLVEKVKETFENLFPMVQVNGIRLDSSALKIDELTVKLIEVDPQEVGNILIHWYPRKDISTEGDPFCSIYMLTEEEINIVYNYLKEVQAYAIKNNH